MSPFCKAEQFILRNSDTKLGYETRRGFLVGLEFRNPPAHPSFVSCAVHLFGNGNETIFFYFFRIRNSDTKLGYESPNKNPHRSFVSEFRIRKKLAGLVSRETRGVEGCCSTTRVQNLGHKRTLTLKRMSAEPSHSGEWSHRVKSRTLGPWGRIRRP